MSKTFGQEVKGKKTFSCHFSAFLAFLCVLRAAHCVLASTRHVNPKISPVVRILPAPWGLSGGNWWLPPSHRVVGAPETPRGAEEKQK
jgi:hypothetical protein